MRSASHLTPSGGRTRRERRLNQRREQTSAAISSGVNPRSNRSLQSVKLESDDPSPISPRRARVIAPVRSALRAAWNFRSNLASGFTPGKFPSFESDGLLGIQRSEALKIFEVVFRAIQPENANRALRRLVINKPRKPQDAGEVMARGITRHSKASPRLTCLRSSRRPPRQARPSASTGAARGPSPR